MPMSTDGRVVPGAPTGGVAAAHPGGGTYFLGRYRVVDEIGIGGMASVHLARMDGPGGFQKWVAIKRIHPHLIEDDSFIHMFLDEARIAARISHPNVATVFELGKHDDTYWIAMEYLHGEPLREVMRRTEETGAPMPPEIACRVIADAAEGLHAAHELLGKNGEKLNLIHRDVTPHNLFVTYEGATKVVDFGIAKFSSRMSSTRAGTLKGKLAYMSPEQVQGETIDRRTDIFALGVVLWELTTGQRLFRMESDLDTLAKVQECVIPRPSSIVRGYPIDLEKIVMKALAKNRGERFKTAREFSRMLQSLLMRRGLFIASDEVANYIQSIFKDRIEKREAHLRWAGEVTQTINVDGLTGAQLGGGIGAGLTGHADPSFHTADPSFRSDVLAASPVARQPPRPAAGVPAATFMASSGASPASAPSSMPRQAPFSPAPPQARPPMPPAPPSRDGRQAPVAQVEPDFDPDDAPTLLATSGAAVYAGGSGFDDDFDDRDDTIVTTAPTEEAPHVQSPTYANANPFAAPPPPAAPLPAAGRPAARPRSSQPPIAPSPLSQPRTLAGFPPARFDSSPDSSSGGPRTLPLNTSAPVGGRSPYDAFPFGATLPIPPQAGGPADASGAGGLPPPTAFHVSHVNDISDPSLPPTHIAMLGSPLGTTAPGDPLQPNPSNLSTGRVPAPTVPRLFAPPNPDQTVQLRTQRSAPLWAVAILAGTAVFIVGGFIFLLVSLFSHSSTDSSATADKTVVTATATAAAPPKPTPAPVPVPTAATTVASTSVAGSAGPFVAARVSFLAALASVPTNVAPSPPPAASASTPAPAPAPPSGSAPAPGTTDTPDTDTHAAAPAPAPAPAPPAAVPVPVDTTPSDPSPQSATQNRPTQQAGVAPPSQGGTQRRATEGATPGLLSIICIPGCDQVYDNGKLLGASPVFKRPASLGSHKIRLVSSNPHVEKVVSTIVAADSVAMVRESMP
jgi:serine/threonine protein kinase